MLNKKSIFVFSFLFFLFISLNLSANKKFLDWIIKPFSTPDQKISTLVVSANYAMPRTLAELIQASNQQPILLIPSQPNNSIYFMPPKSRGSAMEIPYNKLTNFIDFLGANQILILGGSDYIPIKYISEIPKDEIVCRITGNNWNRISKTVSKFLNLPNLANDFSNLKRQLIEGEHYKRLEPHQELSGAQEEETPGVNESIEILPPKAPDTTVDSSDNNEKSSNNKQEDSNKETSGFQQIKTNIENQKPIKK